MEKRCSSLAVLVLALTCVASVAGFVLQPTWAPAFVARREVACRMSVSRQDFLRSAVVGLPVAFGLCTAQPESANALGVGEGGLPAAASDFLDTVQMQKNWDALGKTVSERGSELSGDEWKNIQLYLRKVYQIADNQMKPMAKGFSEPKRSQAIKLADAIKDEAKASDKLAGRKEAEAFLESQRSVAAKIREYMDLFSDIPDEL